MAGFLALAVVLLGPAPTVDAVLYKGDTYRACTAAERAEYGLSRSDTCRVEPDKWVDEQGWHDAVSDAAPEWAT